MKTIINKLYIMFVDKQTKEQKTFVLFELEIGENNKTPSQWKHVIAWGLIH